MKKIVFLIVLVVALGTARAQTTTPMSQYAGNQLIFNPGFAGAHDLFSANLSWKTLWVGVPASPTLISFNMHAPFIDRRNALGLIFQRETFGPQSVNLVNVTYAYNFRIGGQSFLNFGMQVGLFNSVTDWSRVTHVTHPEDIAYGAGQRWATNRFDMGLGAYFQAPDFYVGLSVRHLTAPRFDEVRALENGERYYSRIRRQAFFMAGYNFMLNNIFDLRPRLKMRYKADAPFAVNIGVDFVYTDRFSFGMGFTTGTPTLTLAATAEIWEGIRIGYAFDMNFRVIRQFQRGSHEIFLTYFMPIWNRINQPQARQHFR